MCGLGVEACGVLPFAKNAKDAPPAGYNFIAMKFWLILALATVGIATAQGTPKNGVSKEQASPSTEKPLAADDKQGDSKVTVIVKQENASPENPTKDQDGENIRIQRRVATFTAWLVGVGILQAIILGFTIRAINGQNETNKSIERAWVMAELRCSPTTSLITGTRIVGTVESVSTSLMQVELY